VWDEISRRIYVSKLGASIAGVGFVGQAAGQTAGTDDQSQSDTSLEKEVLVDSPGVRITWVSVDEVGHLVRHHKKGAKQGEIYHVELGKGEGPPDISQSAGSASLSVDSQLHAVDALGQSAAADYQYDKVVRRSERFGPKEFEGCTEYSDYRHIWLARGFELTDPVSVVGKETLTVIIGAIISGGPGTLAGAAAGIVLSLYSDNTFSIIASDDDTPVVGTPRNDLLASGEYEPEVGDGAGASTQYGHLGKDDGTYIIL